MRLARLAAKRSQVLNRASRPEHSMSTGSAGDLPLIIDGEGGAGIGSRQGAQVLKSLGETPGKSMHAGRSIGSAYYDSRIIDAEGSAVITSGKSSKIANAACLLPEECMGISAVWMA